MKTTLTILLASTSIASAGALDYTPPVEPPLTTPERVTDWSGPYIGGSLGWASIPYQAATIGRRAILEDQCWKNWDSNEYYLRLDDVYCTAPDTDGLNQHYVDHAIWHEGEIIGYETFTEYSSGTNEGMAYSVYAGYRVAVTNSLYLGGELEHTWADIRGFDGVTEAKLTAGVSMGNLMPYGYVSYYDAGGQTGMGYGGGVDYRITNSMTVGLEHSIYEGFEVTSVRVGWVF